MLTRAFNSISSVCVFLFYKSISELEQNIVQKRIVAVVCLMTLNLFSHRFSRASEQCNFFYE